MTYRKFLVLMAVLCFTEMLIAQKLDIIIKEPEPYKVEQDITFEIYLINNTPDSITYFDSRGPSWDSFKEIWDLKAIDKWVEILPLNGAHDHNFPDSTILTILPGDTNLIRSRQIYLKSSGKYSFTYTQEQGPQFVEKKFADVSVSDSLIQSINTFKVSQNLKFEVFNNYDTTIQELITMTWDEWKDYRHIKVYTRNNHFDNIYSARKIPQEVYSLIVICDGLDAEDIKRIGQFKNLRALTLRNYPLNFFPKELAALNLYELSITPKNETAISFAEGLSQNNTLRELTAKFYDGIPKQVLNLRYLERLDVSDCAINTLPRLDSLQNLEVLIANNAKISSIKDVGFDQLLKLKDITLSGNKEIDDLTPLLNCNNLEFLVINRTSIQSIPDEIENLQKLKKLSVSNGLTAVSDSLGKLADMRYLSLGGNRSLTYLPANIINMKKLLHLDLSNTKIEALPEGISELPLEKVLIYSSDCKVTKDYKILKSRLQANFKD